VGPDPVIVVGIDGSWPARGALRWAARYARATGALLRAVRVLEWPIGFTSASTGPDGPTLHVPDAELDHSYRHGMQRVFDEVDPLPGWELTFAEGPTAEVLVELAKQADLLVLGSHEHAVEGDAHVGDIGHYCIGRSRRPVVIVPVEYLENLPAEVSSSDGLARGAETLAPL
jgi:nucleotide-binding universal stress UspA family protein